MENLSLLFNAKAHRYKILNNLIEISATGRPYEYTQLYRPKNNHTGADCVSSEMQPIVAPTRAFPSASESSRAAHPTCSATFGSPRPVSCTSRRLSNVNMDEEEPNSVVFPRTLLRRFILLYKENGCLWDKRCLAYRQKQRRRQAITKLTELVQEHDPTATRVHVLRKIESLRACVRREHKRVTDSRRTATCPEEIYTPHLWYYKLFSFVFAGTRSKVDKQTEISPDRILATEEEHEEDEDYEEDEIIEYAKEKTPEASTESGNFEQNYTPEYICPNVAEATEDKSRKEVDDEYDAIGNTDKEEVGIQDTEPLKRRYPFDENFKRVCDEISVTSYGVVGSTSNSVEVQTEHCTFDENFEKACAELVADDCDTNEDNVCNNLDDVQNHEHVASNLNNDVTNYNEPVNINNYVVNYNVVGGNYNNISIPSSGNRIHIISDILIKCNDFCNINNGVTNYNELPNANNDFTIYDEYGNIIKDDTIYCESSNMMNDVTNSNKQGAIKNIEKNNDEPGDKVKCIANELPTIDDADTNNECDYIDYNAVNNSEPGDVEYDIATNNENVDIVEKVGCNDEPNYMNENVIKHDTHEDLDKKAGNNKPPDNSDDDDANIDSNNTVEDDDDDNDDIVLCDSYNNTTDELGHITNDVPDLRSNNEIVHIEVKLEQNDDVIEIKDEEIESNADESNNDFYDSHFVRGNTHTVPTKVVEITDFSPQKRFTLHDISKKMYSEVQDEYDAIGINVAAKLRTLPATMRILAEKLINDVLFQAQMNSLNSSSAVTTLDPIK